jgi:multidrug resistance efflux pump
MNATASRFRIEPPVLNGTLTTTSPALPSRIARRLAWLRCLWIRPYAKRVALAALGLAAASTAWFTLSGSGEHSARVKPLLANQPIAANGVVEGASRERPLAPEVAGTLKQIHVQVNQDVPAGALLFELANDSQQAQVALAEAELAAAQAQLDQAEADLIRAQQMLRGSAVAKHEYDQFFYRAKTTRAKKQEAEARLLVARAELAKTQVRAPVAGRVLQIHKEPGVQVGPTNLGSAGQPVLRLADVSRRRVRAFVEELDVGRVQLGQQASAAADGFPDREYLGQVVEIAGRMGKDAPESDAPGEYKDVYYREVVIELDGARELPLNLRMQVRIAVHSATASDEIAE